jgi:hypothetical protein
VLAGAYGNFSKGKPMLRHAVLVDEDGNLIRVLCNKVNLDSLADIHAGNPMDAPTCETCKRRLGRILWEEAAEESD